MKFRDTIGPGTVLSDGTLTLKKRPVAGTIWQVTQIAVQCTGSQLSTCRVLVNDLFVCGTKSGNQDVGSNDPPIRLADGDEMKLSWANATPGAIAQATFFYDIVSG